MPFLALMKDVSQSEFPVRSTSHPPWEDSSALAGAKPLPVTTESAHACVTVSEPVGMPADGLLLLSHPVPPDPQICPVTSTSAYTPEVDISALPIVMFPVARTEAEVPQGSSGKTYEQASLKFPLSRAW